MFAGDGLYGKVDHVPGQFFVATRFMHYLWFPILPRESYLVRDDGSQHFIRIPLRWKSVLIAWTRNVLICMGVTLFCGGVAFFRMELQNGESHPRVIAAVLWALASAMAGLCFLSYRFTRPGPQRVSQLRALLSPSTGDMQPDWETADKPSQLPTLAEVAREIGHGALDTSRSVADAATDQVSDIISMVVMVSVAGGIAVFAMAIGTIALHLTVLRLGRSVILECGVALLIAVTLPALVRMKAQHILKQPAYFGESRGFWIALGCLSWMLGAFLSIWSVF